MRKLFLAAALLVLASPIAAQSTSSLKRPDQLIWTAHPALPKGAQVTYLLGDPSKAGDAVVYRIKYPASYKIPPHTHPGPEVVTVLSGSFAIGEGNTFDEHGGQMLPAGSFFAFPPKHAHFGWTGEQGAILQVQTVGPVGIDYVNPADDPRRSQ
jgi:quercetin dioxygenase-like cupin family protein